MAPSLKFPLKFPAEDLPRELLSWLKKNPTVYVVGGALRNFLLDSAAFPLGSAELDFAGPLPPEQLWLPEGSELIPLGRKFGHALIKMPPQGPYDYTQYRQDIGISNHRHPSEVTMINNLQEDLCRRDFTINSFAWNPTTGDIQWAMEANEDLSQRVLRTIGEPALRFQEDAIRVLRGVRFSLTYQLSIETTTWASMIQSRSLLRLIHPSRLDQELRKIPMATLSLAPQSLIQILRFLKEHNSTINNATPASNTNQPPRLDRIKPFTKTWLSILSDPVLGLDQADIHEEFNKKLFQQLLGNRGYAALGKLCSVGSNH